MINNKIDKEPVCVIMIKNYIYDKKGMISIIMFEELTKENLKAFEEKNRDILKKLFVNKSNETHNQLLKELGDIEGIESILNFDSDYELINRAVDDAFSMEKMSNNSFSLENVKDDLKPYVRGLAYSSKEAVGIFLIENGMVKSFSMLPFGKETEGHGDTTDIIEVVIKSGCKDFAIVHNHPNHIAAYFTSSDDSFNKRLGWFSKAFGLNFMDSFVVTPFDCCSSVQKCHGRKDISVKSDEIGRDKFIQKTDKESMLLSSIVVKGLS